MKCHEVEQFLSDFLEDTLTAAERQEVEGHLKSCRDCQLLLEDLKTVMAWCESFPELTPPSSLVERIIEMTSGHVQSLSWWEYLKELFKPVYSTPRFAAGTCMAVISFVLVLNAFGVHWSQIRQIEWSKVTPRSLFQSLNRSVYLAYDNGVRRINDLKILYQIQSRLDEYRTEQSESKDTPKEKPKDQPKPHETSSMQHMVAFSDGISSSPKMRQDSKILLRIVIS
ncbi:MAG TPA: zf-HC2 domain-containing protein [Terriglobia bacterium]|nr:zf-HC2 domain-containing protein [Terriglobia bacterium]